RVVDRGAPIRGTSPMEKMKSGRPLPGEFADYATADIAAVPGDDAIDALAILGNQTVELFHSLAGPADRGLTYAPARWTIKEVLGHLIDDERIFAYRLLCVARGEPLELRGFDEKLYAAAGEFEKRTLDSLLSEYRSVREATLRLLENLPPSAWL